MKKFWKRIANQTVGEAIRWLLWVGIPSLAVMFREALMELMGEATRIAITVLLFIGAGYYVRGGWIAMSREMEAAIRRRQGPLVNHAEMDKMAIESPAVRFRIVPPTGTRGQKAEGTRAQEMALARDLRQRFLKKNRLSAVGDMVVKRDYENFLASESVKQISQHKKKEE